MGVFSLGVFLYVHLLYSAYFGQLYCRMGCTAAARWADCVVSRAMASCFIPNVKFRSPADLEVSTRLSSAAASSSASC